MHNTCDIAKMLLLSLPLQPQGHLCEPSGQESTAILQTESCTLDPPPMNFITVVPAACFLPWVQPVAPIKGNHVLSQGCRRRLPKARSVLSTGELVGLQNSSKPAAELNLEPLNKLPVKGNDGYITATANPSLPAVKTSSSHPRILFRRPPLFYTRCVFSARCRGVDDTAILNRVIKFILRCFNDCQGDQVVKRTSKQPPHYWPLDAVPPVQRRYTSS